MLQINMKTHLYTYPFDVQIGYLGHHSTQCHINTCLLHIVSLINALSIGMQGIVGLQIYLNLHVR
jgi:hypothetical protein